MLYVPAYSDLALGSGVVFGAAGWVVLQLKDATFLPSTVSLPVTHAQRDNLRVQAMTEPDTQVPAHRDGRESPAQRVVIPDGFAAPPPP